METVVQERSKCIPEQLKRYKQWVCWKYHAGPGDGRNRRRKVPVDPKTGRFAKVTDRSTWTSLGEAEGTLLKHGDSLEGVGFVFTEHDPFVGIDLDDVLDPRTKQLDPWAQKVIDSLNSYTEVSPSGTGVKAIVSADTTIRSRRRSSPGIEIYRTSRFFTVTGDVFDGHSELRNGTQALNIITETYFPKPEPSNHRERTELLPSVASDEAVLNKASNARNGSKFKRLWRGDTREHDGNSSQADLGLCRLLAFWCGPNPDQVDRLFRQSELFRSKWDERHFSDGTTYGMETIKKAIAAQGDAFYRWCSYPKTKRESNEL